jgi:cell filamentation protein, protein adenylyltransferase
MDSSQDLKERLDALRPLDAGRIARLFPHLRAEGALYVYTTNAVEGSTLTLGETIAVLEHGVSIGGKPVADHLDAINGQKAYALMLDLARQRAPITLETILNLHRADVAKLRTRERTRCWRSTPRNAALTSTRSRRPRNCISACSRFIRSKDGNGRTACLLQNLALIREGYVPVLIGPEEKPRYFDVLQSAQVAVPGVGDPAPFVAYVADLEAAALRRYLASLE